MGNHSKTGKTNQKTQPSMLRHSAAAEVLGNGGGGSSSKSIAESIDIKLIQLQLGAVGRAQPGNTVTIQWSAAQVAYEVHLQGDLLGIIPSNYNSTLLPNKKYSGRVVVADLTPSPAVTIRVRLTVGK